ncbi:3941_t:CDS:2 [Gigaspora margarita]|uniref:3941_t:CDS:1 n=1 Tax=Gigaspora margarita TaxID=4874 RepID=A0ABM8W3M0_GIGMA|nr:3941_t:CDS:2 [Gigaspora margarita]
MVVIAIAKNEAKKQKPQSNNEFYINTDSTTYQKDNKAIVK